jgi:Protein of unknown function (DUF3631)
MDIADAKAVLPFPALLNRLGVPTPDKDKFNIPCLLHNEQNGKSFSVERKNGTWLWHCFGKCARGGDEITFLEVYKSVPRDAAIELYLEMARNGATKAWPKLAAAPAQFDWQKCVDDCGEENIDGIAKWRGFSPGFVKELRDKGQIGIYRGRVAFPVHDDGKIVGIHVRLKNGDWYYEPKGLKAAPLVFGELVSDERVQIFESTWDGLDYMDKSGERDGIIITRGASNGARVCNLIPSGSTLFLWPQNDEPGEKWARDICTHTNAIVKRAKTPAHHKDLNDWTRAGATTDDLLAAILNAETLQEAAPVWSPGELFNEIKAHITRYVVFSEPEHASVLALWVMHTWVIQSFDFTPYVYLHSPVMRCGKTQVHRVVEPLVKNPLRTCNVSEAALYREIEESHPTLLWDEIDSIFGNRKSSEVNENKRALLNAGYERGMMAIRMERGAGGFVKISFDPFCPKILAGIGRLPDTIVDRSIPILIHRRLKNQPCQKYRRRDRAAAKPLHDALEIWATDAELLKTLRASHPQMPEFMSDRQEDIWEPLLAIADAIGGDVPKLAREAARVLCDNDDELGYGATQLAAIRKVVGEQDRITSSDLINGLWEAGALPSRLMEDEEPNHKKIGHWLSKFIKSYGGKPARKLRFDEKTLMGYEAADLKQIFDRYCPPEQE